MDEALDEHIKLGGHLANPTLLRSKHLDRLPPKECGLVRCSGGRVGLLEDLNFRKDIFVLQRFQNTSNCLWDCVESLTHLKATLL